MKRERTIPTDGEVEVNRVASIMTDAITTPESPRSQIVDGLDLWDDESKGGAATSPLAVIPVDANERLLVLFTTSMERVTLHYLDYASIRSYVRCNGSDCVLCRVGRQQEVRDLLPVYAPLDRVIGVLPVSTNMRPMALRPKLAPVLRQLKGGNGRALIAIRKLDAGKVVLDALPFSENADDGAAKIQEFHERLQAGEIGLARVYTQLANEDLAAIPEIGRAMQIKGIKLP
jgi:hypothetical protein